MGSGGEAGRTGWGLSPPGAGLWGTWDRGCCGHLCEGTARVWSWGPARTVPGVCRGPGWGRSWRDIWRKGQVPLGPLCQLCFVS